MKKILVTGALGQIGSELIPKLRDEYGTDNVIATWRESTSINKYHSPDLNETDKSSEVRNDKQRLLRQSGPHETLDVTDALAIFNVGKKYQVDTFIHLAALLSGSAEANPLLAWKINMGGLVNALEAARELQCQFFTPSSIGAFGPSTPKDNTPQVTIQRPTFMYGINKVSGELLCDYYYLKFGVDTRGVRFPGLITNVTQPEGGTGTTDYAVEIYYGALKKGKYTSYIAKGTYMDMMYMPDALDTIIKLMEADPTKLIHRNAYNVSAISAEPDDFAEEIRKIMPDFKMDYNVDPVRQAIADSWPNSIDPTAAKEEWGFATEYDLPKLTSDMLEKLQNKLRVRSERFNALDACGISKKE